MMAGLLTCGRGMDSVPAAASGAFPARLASDVPHPLCKGTACRMFETTYSCGGSDGIAGSSLPRHAPCFPVSSLTGTIMRAFTRARDVVSKRDGRPCLTHTPPVMECHEGAGAWSDIKGRERLCPRAKRRQHKGAYDHGVRDDHHVCMPGGAA